jgi:hypothetical protein
MSIAHQVKHRLELTIKKATDRITLSWEPEDLDMITVWASGEPYAYADWKLINKTELTFGFTLEKGTKLTVREFEVVGKKKRKKKC